MVETTEKITEAYVRYVKGWLTIPNIKCKGQMEIDLLAVDVSHPDGIRRYHIESGVSISGGFSRLTNKPFSPGQLKERVREASQRRTLGYFAQRKFSDPKVIERLRAFGFVPQGYTKVIVSWGWDDDVPPAAAHAGIELWDFRTMLNEIARQSRANRTYFTDDTMRTLQLMTMATES
jgi:hypothetical protein